MCGRFGTQAEAITSKQDTQHQPLALQPAFRDSRSIARQRNFSTYITSMSSQILSLLMFQFV